MNKYECGNLSDDYWIGWATEIREWIKGKTGCVGANIFKDGIICEKVFSDSDFRPLFILKEVSDKGPYTEVLQDIRESDIKNGVTMWRKLVTLAREMYRVYDRKDNVNYEIIHNPNDPKKSKNAEESEYVPYCNKIAVINLKKAHGGPTADSEESRKTVVYPCHACKYREMLLEQITRINPSVIICCGTYDVLKDNVYCDRFSEIEGITIKGYHPSNINGNKKFYDEVLERYKEILEDI